MSDPIPPAVASARSARTWWKVGIGAASVILLGVIVWAIVTVAALAPDVMRRAGILEPGELSTGEAGDPVAAEPDECPEDCFNGLIGDDLVLSDETLDALGFTERYAGIGDYASSTPSSEHRITAKIWVEDESTPVNCFFTAMYAPSVYPLNNPPTGNFEPMQLLGTSTDESETYSIDQSIRIFATSELASEHMSDLADAVDGCSQMQFGTGSSVTTAEVVAMPALSLPASVSASGWTEEYGFGRHYVADIQRSNLVVRTLVWTDARVTENDFRTTVEDLAVRLSELDY